jgi:hypothetical protein
MQEILALPKSETSQSQPVGILERRRPRFAQDTLVGEGITTYRFHL